MENEQRSRERWQELAREIERLNLQDPKAGAARAEAWLAEETGGLAVVNQNDFDKALKRIDAESSDYYILGYYSSNPDPTKRRRKIEVKVKKQDVNVISRTEYVLRPTPKSDK